MEKKKLPKTVTRVIALMICAAFLSLSGLAILYRVDNKYTAKTEMVQEHVTLLTVCSRPGTFQFKLPLPVIRSGPGNIRTWPYSILTEILTARPLTVSA